MCFRADSRKDRPPHTGHLGPWDLTSALAAGWSPRESKEWKKKKRRVVILRGNLVHSVSLNFIEARRTFPTHQRGLSVSSAQLFIRLFLPHYATHNLAQTHTLVGALDAFTHCCKHLAGKQVSVSAPETIFASSSEHQSIISTFTVSFIYIKK